ncbi:MAG: sigma 54-interacting transcriptional regulator, partial [Terracidiphilus sp.]
MASIATIQSAKRQQRPVTPTSSMEARIQRAIARIAETDCPMLILGEHGVGKRAVAAQIHALSSHSRSHYQELHCEDTDAAALEAALLVGGTVYLAEVTELGLALQERLVNYFHAAEKPACRILCGSSRELPEEVKAWRMREDFYYLVSAITLRIPPLRCRKSEILL